MPRINFARREVVLKLVFYGCAGAGKVTALASLARELPGSTLATFGLETAERFARLERVVLAAVPSVGAFRAVAHLHTDAPPPPVYGNRPIVLAGVDGLVLVVDSRGGRREANSAALVRLDASLRAQGLELRTLPHVVLYTHGDVPDAAPLEVLEQRFNSFGAPSFVSDTVGAHGTLLATECVMVLAAERARAALGPR